MKVKKVKVAQSCLTLCDPMDYTVHGILQARIPESGSSFPSPRGSSQPRDQTQVSCIAGGFFTNWATREAHSLYSSAIFQKENPWPGLIFLPSCVVWLSSPASHCEQVFTHKAVTTLCTPLEIQSPRVRGYLGILATLGMWPAIAVTSWGWVWGYDLAVNGWEWEEHVIFWEHTFCSSFRVQPHLSFLCWAPLPDLPLCHNCVHCLYWTVPTVCVTVLHWLIIMVKIPKISSFIVVKHTGLQGITCIPIVVQPSLILSQRNSYSNLFLVLFLLSD